MSFAAYVKLIAPTLKPEMVHEASGLFLFVWTIFSVTFINFDKSNLQIQMYMLVASLKVSKLLTSVFVTLVIALILLTVGTLR